MDTKDMISLDHLLEKNIVPDPLIRIGIRRMLAGKMNVLEAAGTFDQVHSR